MTSRDSILKESWSAWEGWLPESELNLHRWLPFDARSQDRRRFLSLNLLFAWCDEPWHWDHLTLNEAEHTWGNCLLWEEWDPLTLSFLLEFWSHLWCFRFLHLDPLRYELLMWPPRDRHSCSWSLRRSLRELLQWRSSLWWRLCDLWLPEGPEQTPDSQWRTGRWESLLTTRHMMAWHHRMLLVMEVVDSTLDLNWTSWCPVLLEFWTPMTSLFFSWWWCDVIRSRRRCVVVTWLDGTEEGRSKWVSPRMMTLLCYHVKYRNNPWRWQWQERSETQIQGREWNEDRQNQMMPEIRFWEMMQWR